MVPADLAIAAVMKSVDGGLAIAAAQRILLREADSDDQHPKISGALRLVADGLSKHPAPLALLESNIRRYNAEVAEGDPARWGDVRAVHITAAAMAFENAAAAMREKAPA